VAPGDTGAFQLTLKALGSDCSAVAARYGVARKTVRRIITGQNWFRVP
jgi:plasmid maintenance system antidote protein VapI